MERLGVGLIGSGFMGMAHAFGITTARKVFALPYEPDFVVLADRNDEEAEAARQRFGFRRATSEWRALCADPEVDVVHITTPNALHNPMALEAIANGKHVHCEKPLALNVRDSAEMVRSAAEAGVKTQVGFNYLCNPMMILARDMIAGGEIGEVFGYRGKHVEYYMGDPEGPWTFRLEPEGGGALADVGGHTVSVAEFLLGPIVSVYGDCRTVIPVRRGPDGEPRQVQLDDITRAFVTFESGVSGSLEANWLTTGEKMGLTFEVYGSKGALHFTQERLNELQYYSLDDPTGRHGFRTILASPDHPPYGAFCVAPGHQIGFNDMKAIEMMGFYEAIAGLRPEPFSFAAGHRVEVVTDTIKRSSDEARWLPIDVN